MCKREWVPSGSVTKEARILKVEFPRKRQKEQRYIFNVQKSKKDKIISPYLRSLAYNI